MSKVNGLGITTFSIDDSAGSQQAVKNDITSFTINTPRAIQDVTGIDKSAMERLLLLADCTVGASYVFNDAATTGIFTVLNNYATLAASQVGRTTTITFSGSAGAHTLAQELLYDDFPSNRAASGELTGQVTGRLANGTLAAWS